MRRDLETIKMYMEENLNEFKEFQKKQLETYKMLMEIADIDELDAKIEEIEQEFRFSTELKDITFTEKEIFKSLIDLAWNSKYKGDEATNE